MTTYKTMLGDTWDVISFRLFGDEHFMDELIKSNFEHRKTTVFKSGVILNVPDVDIEAKQASDDLPIWKRGR